MVMLAHGYDSRFLLKNKNEKLKPDFMIAIKIKEAWPCDIFLIKKLIYL